MVRVNDLEELLATTVLFSTLTKLPHNTGLASINLSGGETGICADMGDAHGIPYPDFGETTLARLRELLPDYASPANPLDSTATISYDTDTYAAVLRAVMDDPGVGMVILGYTLLLDIADPAIRYMAQGIEKVVREGGAKPMAMLPFVENTRNPEYLEKLTRLGVPVLPPPAYAFSVLNHLKRFIEYDPSAHTLKVGVPSRQPAKGRHTLSEFQSMQLLSEYGIPVPKGGVASTHDEAVAQADSCGYPVALKIASADIGHKSDMGGVKLGLEDSVAVRVAFDDNMHNARTNAPDARLDGVFVQSMLEPGREMIIGVFRDPQFGPCILCGLGGVFVEVFNEDIHGSVQFRPNIRSPRCNLWIIAFW